jgi:hypothetical protein
MTNGPTEITRYEWAREDLEDLLKEMYGVNWDGQAAMGFPSQSTYHEVEVEGTRQSIVYAMNWIDDEKLLNFKYAKEIITNFKAGMYVDRTNEWPFALPSLEFILQWLCFQGHIPCGNYMITVDW